MQAIKFRPRPLWKETSNHYRGNVIVIALEPGAVLLRLKRKRTTYRVPVDLIFQTGAALEARRLRAEAVARRKAKAAAKRNGGAR